jgi:hypothetical protein
MTYRSFIRSPLPEERFLANWRLPHGTDADHFVRDRLARLSRQLLLPYRWAGSLAITTENWENPGISSGYTYFAQFVAHDCVQSTTPTSALRIDGRPDRNYRSKTLELDTIYGAGFDGCRHSQREHSGNNQNASKFTLGRMQDTRTVEARCPARDLPRVSSGRASLVVDDRNDNNAVISQMAVLFMMLHNMIVDALEDKILHSPKQLGKEASLYVIARWICIDVYQRLIAKDLMKKLLHPAIYAKYSSDSVQFVDRNQGTFVPIEFPLALRFGHSMVRPNYRFNDVYGRREELIDVLLTTSRGRPWRLPLDESWAISWSRFFPISDSQPNLSRRIGPSFSADLISDVVFGEIDGTNCPGIAYRDLLQCVFSPVWSISALIDQVRQLAPELAGLSRLFDDASYRESAIGRWLDLDRGATGLSSAAIEDFSKDIPLTMYVLFEAAHESDGRHLGVLGSLLISEVIFKAFQERRAEPAPWVGKDQFNAIEAVTSQTNQINTMPDLVKFLSNQDSRASLMVPFI